MNKPALSASLKILVDGGKDVIAALKPGESLSQKIAAFENLIPDAVAELQVIGNVSAEIASLKSEDYVELAGELVADIGLSDDHAKAVAQAGLKLLGDSVSGALPDLIAFVHALKA